MERSCQELDYLVSSALNNVFTYLDRFPFKISFSLFGKKKIYSSSGICLLLFNCYFTERRWLINFLIYHLPCNSRVNIFFNLSEFWQGSETKLKYNLRMDVWELPSYWFFCFLQHCFFCLCGSPLIAFSFSYYRNFSL